MRTVYHRDFLSLTDLGFGSVRSLLCRYTLLMYFSFPTGAWSLGISELLSGTWISPSKTILWLILYLNMDRYNTELLRYQRYCVLAYHNLKSFLCSKFIYIHNIAVFMYHGNSTQFFFLFLNVMKARIFFKKYI